MRAAARVERGRVDAAVGQAVEQLVETRVRVRAQAEDAVEGGRARGFGTQPGHAASAGSASGASIATRSARSVGVEHREVAAEHPVGARLGKTPPIVQRLRLGIRLGPAEDREHRRRAHDDGLDRREPDGEHRRAVQRAPQLAQRIQAVQRERLRVLRAPEARASRRRAVRPRPAPRRRRDPSSAATVGQSISSGRCAVAHACPTAAHSRAACSRDMTSAERSHASCRRPGAKKTRAATTTSACTSPSTPARPRGRSRARRIRARRRGRRWPRRS